MTVFKPLLCVVLVCITGLLVALYPNAEPINKPLHESTSAEVLIQDFSVNNTETTLATSPVKEKSKHPTDASTEHNANHNQHSNKQHDPATEEKAFVDDDAMSIEAFLQKERHKAMVIKELVDVPLEQALAQLKDVPEFMLREVPGLKDRPPTNKDYSATNFPISPCSGQVKLATVL
ncbi:hypothetical protein [Catenovulum agarivorans]|uniref:hypothetical protein n=1 Tax=Catenovulum agarivorans TaxID=1172192 RepID=UPI000304DD6F|nr:hypothetical protein [Catenovulum agarivorans]